MQRQGTTSDFGGGGSKQSITFKHSNSKSSIGSDRRLKKQQSTNEKPTSLAAELTYNKHMKRN